MLIDFVTDIENNKDRMIQYFFDSVESDILSWKRNNTYYSNGLESKVYDGYYFRINLDKNTLEIKQIITNNSYILVKYGYFRNMKVRRYTKYIIGYLENSVKMNFLETCVSIFEKIFIKETRKEKLEKIMKNT